MSRLQEIDTYEGSPSLPLNRNFAQSYGERIMKARGWTQPETSGITITTADNANREIENEDPLGNAINMDYYDDGKLRQVRELLAKLVPLSAASESK